MGAAINREEVRRLIAEERWAPAEVAGHLGCSIPGVRSVMQLFGLKTDPEAVVRVRADAARRGGLARRKDPALRKYPVRKPKSKTEPEEPAYSPVGLDHRRPTVGRTPMPLTAYGVSEKELARSLEAELHVECSKCGRSWDGRAAAMLAQFQMHDCTG